jgi:hypothetical protein
LHEEARPLDLLFKRLEALHWSSVKHLHCTGVCLLHWSLHCTAAVQRICTGVVGLHWSLHWYQTQPLVPILQCLPRDARLPSDLPLGETRLEKLAELVVGQVRWHGWR